jgi:integrase/recombinase XerD
MFDQLFERPHALKRQCESPLAEERNRYLTHLAQQGMARKTLRDAALYLLVITEYLHLPEHPQECFPLEQIAEAAERWANREPRPPNMQGVRTARRRFLHYGTGWLTFLGRFQAPCPQASRYDPQIAEFAAFMQQQRGLSPATIEQRCLTVRAFLTRICNQERALNTLTVSDIDTALAQMVQEQRYARCTVQTCASSLRAFFRYAQSQGWCSAGLAAAIMAPRVFRNETLPSAPSWEQVRQLLASTAGEKPTQIRDHALLLLLSVYGLRAGEIVRLQLDDIDWKKETICFRRSKRLGTATYPLCQSVGDALVRYLRDVRPQSAHREVFLTLRPPFRPLTSSTLWPVVARRLRPLAGALKHHGPHALRHACATHLLNEGHSLKEVGDHLGHHSPETTRIYAKVDMPRLREVANFDLGGLL